MNIDNMIKLRDWLQAGAPHVLFTMDHGRMTTQEYFPFKTLEGLRDHLESDGGFSDDQFTRQDLGECGTVCCIAGAASWLAGIPNEEVAGAGWEEIQILALEFLQLEDSGKDFHPLFDPTLCPPRTSPVEAARAVQNMIDFGEPRWETVRV